jgi:hypothetical protein
VTPWATTIWKDGILITGLASWNSPFTSDQKDLLELLYWHLKCVDHWQRGKLAHLQEHWICQQYGMQPSTQGFPWMLLELSTLSRDH